MELELEYSCNTMHHHSAPLLLLLFCSAAVLPATGLDNGLGRTPPMTWSPWNHFTIHATEDIILANAKALVTTGLHKLGYNLVYELNNPLPRSLSPSPSLSLSLTHTHSLSIADDAGGRNLLLLFGCIANDTSLHSSPTQLAAPHPPSCILLLKYFGPILCNLRSPLQADVRGAIQMTSRTHTHTRTHAHTRTSHKRARSLTHPHIPMQATGCWIVGV